MAFSLAPNGSVTPMQGGAQSLTNNVAQAPAPSTSTAASGGNTQALQQIVNQLVSQSQNGGLAPGTAASEIQQSLSSAGGFTPQQIQAIVQQWNTSNNPAGGMLTDKGGGNTAAEQRDWLAELQQGLNSANSNTAQQNASISQIATPTNPNAATPAASPAATPATSPGVASTAPGVTTSPGLSVQTIQSLFQPQYMSAPPTAQATQYQGSVSPDQTIQAIYQQLNPQFAQATSNLNNQLAASGIEGGSAIDAQQQLQSAETGDLGSAVQAAIQSAQGLNQQAGLANTSAENAMTAQNLANLFGTNQYNTTTANTAQQDYANALLGQYNTDASQFNTLNNAQLSNVSGQIGQNASASSNLTNGVANNYQIQTGAGTGIQNLTGQLGSAYQQYLDSQSPASANTGAYGYNTYGQTTPTTLA